MTHPNVPTTAEIEQSRQRVAAMSDLELDRMLRRSERRRKIDAGLDFAFAGLAWGLTAVVVVKLIEVVLTDPGALWVPGAE